MHTANHSDSFNNPLSLVGRDGSANFQRRMPGHVERLAKTRMEKDTKPEKIRLSLLKKIFLVTVILLIASLLMYISALFFGDNLSRAGHSSSTEKLEIIINNDYLKVPANKIRFYAQRHSGGQKQLDLYMHWPSLSGFTDELKSEFNSSKDNTNLIFLSIEPRNMSYDMSGRVSLIYEQFFEGSPVQTNVGLLKQGLSSKGGFIDEDLYYAAASPYPFATRCVRKSTGIAPFCIRDIHIGKGLMLTYRFHQQYLPQWIELEQTISALAKSMIVNPTS